MPLSNLQSDILRLLASHRNWFGSARIPIRTQYLAMWLSCALLCFFAANYAQAQHVVTLDLTQPRPQSPTSAQLGHYDEDYNVACNGSGGADGEVIDKRRDDHLALSIVDAQPELRDGQAHLTVTVRLKNLNVYVPAEVPWELSPVVPIQTDPHDPSVMYEAASIELWIRAPKPTERVPDLRGSVSFWAQPGNSSQHLKLKPGEWVDLKFSVQIVCKSGEEEVCSSFLDGGAVQLIAFWWERDLEHVRKGCVVTDSAYTSREFESSPFEFAYPLPLKPESTTPKPVVSPKAN